MEKLKSKLHFIVSLVGLIVSNLILLFAGTINYDTQRIYGCYGTGCYGAGNGTGGTGYSKMRFTMLSGMGIDDDACALSIMLFIMVIACVVMFIIELMRERKNQPVRLFPRIVYYAVFGTLLMTFSIYNAVNASNSSGVGGDIIAPFSFMWLVGIIALVVFDVIMYKKSKKQVQ